MRTRIRNEKRTGLLTVEADTPEIAMAALTERLGRTAHVETARSVRKGGFAGFFARERFELRGRPASPGDNAPLHRSVLMADEEMDEAPSISPSTDFGTALSTALFGPAAESGEDEVGKGISVLVADDPVPTSVGPFAGDRHPVAADLPTLVGRSSEVLDDLGIRHLDEEVPERLDGSPTWRVAEQKGPVVPGMGRIAWSATALQGRGMPKIIVDAAAHIDERDDLGWINAIADAVAPHCRDLLDEPTVYVGAGADQIGTSLGVPVIRAGSRRVPKGSFATDVSDEPAALNWLGAVLRRRRLHLVVGEAPWLHLLVADPDAVSFAIEESVVDALYVALTLGASLGHGPSDAGSIVRLTPIETALAVRRLVGRQ